MRSHFPAFFLIIFLCTFTTPDNSYSHGGGHEKASQEVIETPPIDKHSAVEEIITSDTEATFENSIYDEGADTSADMGLGEYDLGEEDSATIQDSSHMMDSMTDHDTHEGMAMSGDDHSGHEMKEVELATHEWVSSSQKGYSAAMGITILAGLVFGFLTLKRPFE
jgi:hypothetical protein